MPAASPFVIEESFENQEEALVAVAGPRGPGRLLRRTGARLEWPALAELAHGGRTPAAPPAPETPKEPTYTQAELDAAVAEARIEAAKDAACAARAELHASLEQRQTDALVAIARTLADAEVGYREAVRARARDTKELALAIARALAPRALALAPLADVETMLQGVIGSLHAQPRLELRLPPELEAPGRGLLARVAAEAGFEGELEVAADDTLGPGGARLRWRHGLAARDLARLEAEARAVVDAWLPDEADTPGEHEPNRTADPAAAEQGEAGRQEGTDE